MFTGKGAVEAEDKFKELLFGPDAIGVFLFVVFVHHDVDMDVAVPGMAEGEDD